MRGLGFIIHREFRPKSFDSELRVSYELISTPTCFEEVRHKYCWFGNAPGFKPAYWTEPGRTSADIRWTYTAKTHEGDGFTMQQFNSSLMLTTCPYRFYVVA